MADIGSTLFLAAIVLTFFLPRIAASIALAAAILCFPFYLHVLMPGPSHWIFRGEYSFPLSRAFYWDNWAVVGVLSLLVAAILSICCYSKVRADKEPLI